MFNKKTQSTTVIGFIATVFAVFSVALFSVLSVKAQDFTQGYSADEQLIRGSIVALDKVDTTKVVAINDTEINDMFGVVVRANDSPLTLTGDRTGVFVATSGRYDVLVSDLNGPILKGDSVTLSSVNGVGMLSDINHVLLVGTALEEFTLDNKNNEILDTIVTKDLQGNDVSVSFGRILVEISVEPNPDARNIQQVPKFLATVAASITGNNDVSAFRVYAGLVVLLIASGVAGSLLYSAVRSSIVAIGRNPLSKKSVLAGLAQVVIVGVIIFLSGLVAVYLILKI